MRTQRAYRRVITSVLLIAALTAPFRASWSIDEPQAESSIEETIWKLLDDDKAVYVTLADAVFRSLGEGFDLPDEGKTVTALAEAALGGAFDPRDVGRIAPETLGYKADWIVERYRRYNLD